MPRTKNGGWMLDDRSVDYPIYGEQCARCRHWSNEPPADYIGSKCKAFPRRIPREILEGKFDHSLPFPGDGGVRFEPKP